MNFSSQEPGIEKSLHLVIKHLAKLGRVSPNNGGRISVPAGWPPASIRREHTHNTYVTRDSCADVLGVLQTGTKLRPMSQHALLDRDSVAKDLDGNAAGHWESNVASCLQPLRTLGQLE